MKTNLLLLAFLLYSVMASYGQPCWYYTNLSESKSGMGAVVLGTEAWFAGGFNGTEYLSTVEVFDVNTMNAVPVGDLSVSRYMTRGVVCGTKILFAGGFDWTKTYATVDIYDTETKQWSVAQLSVDRFSIAGVSNGSKALFAGGFQYPSITWKKTVDIYDCQTGQWTTTNLSLPREGIAAAVVGDLALFAGGSATSVTTTDRVDFYHFSTGDWTTGNLSQARSKAMITTIGNKVIIAGGVTSSNNPTSRVDIYDANTETWDTASLSFPRSLEGGFAATINGKAYFAGGGIFYGSGFHFPSDVIDIYDNSTGTWTTGTLSQPLLDHSVLGIGNYLIVAGGENDLGEIVSSVEILDIGVGIFNQKRNDEHFRVYPNPGSGNIHINISNDNHKCLLSYVYNMQGQLVFNQPLINKDRKLNLQLPAGVYVLRVISDDTIYSELITVHN